MTTERIKPTKQEANELEEFIKANAKRVVAPPETEDCLALASAIDATTKALELYDGADRLTDHVKNKMAEAFAAMGEAEAYVAYILFGPPGYRPSNEDDDYDYCE